MPGENYINSSEHNGLPGTTDLERYARHQAKHVVRAHTRKKGGWMPAWLSHHDGPDDAPRARKSKGKTRVHAVADSDTDSEKHPADVEATAAEGIPKRKMGGGVLSALLTLYDRNQSLLTFSSPSTARSSLDIPDRTPETNDNTLRNAGVELPEKSWSHNRPQHPHLPIADPVPPPLSAPTLGSKAAPRPKRPGYKLSRYASSDLQVLHPLHLTNIIMQIFPRKQPPHPQDIERLSGHS